MGVLSGHSRRPMSMLFGNESGDVCEDILTPKSRVYIQEVDSNILIMMIACSFICLLTVLIFLEASWHIVHEMANWKPKNKALLLLGMYPVTSFNALVGLFLPRTSGLTDLVTALYFSICLYVFSQMLFGHYGGKEKMVMRLADRRMLLNNPPMFCCLFCLPDIPVTARNLRIFEILIMQFVVLRPILGYAFALIAIDSGPSYIFDSSQMSSFMVTMMSIAMTVSTMTAVYGNHCLFKVSIEPLRHVRIFPKFYLLQAAVLLDNIQSMFVNVLITSKVLTCDPPLNTNATSQRVHQILIIPEMFLMAIVARIYYRVTALGRVLPNEDLFYEEGVTRDVGTSYTPELAPGENHVLAPPVGTINSSCDTSEINMQDDDAATADV